MLSALPENNDIRVLGSLTAGTQWSTFSLSHIGYTSLLSRVAKLTVPQSKDGISSFLGILKFTAKLRKHLETEVRTDYGFREGSSASTAVLPYVATPKKEKKPEIIGTAQ